jgi:hypothetical protein
MPGLELTPKSDVSSFRRIAIRTWADAYDPSGRKPTVSHLMAKVAAMALKGGAALRTVRPPTEKKFRPSCSALIRKKWRRRESNPRPKALRLVALHA